MTVLGKYVVLFSLLASGLSAWFYYRAAVGKGSLKIARRLMTAMIAGILLASLLLLVLIVSHDFTNGYVYSYSSRDLPGHFLVSSFYAGQEGSFLFWILCAALIAVPLQVRTKSLRTEPWVMSAYLAVQTFLLVLLVAKSPFRFVWEMIPGATEGTVPADGRGLNPLLQNFWMVAHPPVLFLGFAALAVPFAYAVAALWQKKFSLLPDQGTAWVVFGALVLGIGIMLGAYWAYGVLGWGGYWGWDPVENSSLVPWITSMALLHTLLAQKRTGRYVRTNMILAVASYLLVVYSTFLTRSGILGDSSVHSFVDPGTIVYGLLLAFLLGVGLLGGVLIASRWSLMARQSTGAPLLSRESALGAGALALLISAAIILFGTSLPILGKSTVEPAFYDRTTMPLAILMSVLIAFSLFTQWNAQDGRATLQRSIRSLVLALGAALVLIPFGVHDPGVLVFLFAAFFALFSNVQFAWTVGRVDPRQLGGKLGHIGLALMFVGIIVTGRFSSTENVILPLGAPTAALGHTMTYTGYRPLPDGKFAFDVKVERDGGAFQLAPVMFEAGEQGIMRNPDMASFLARDFYLSPVSLQQPEHNHAHETYTIPKGGTVEIGPVKARFVRFDMGQHGGDAMTQGGGMTVGSVLELTRGTETETVMPTAVYGGDGEPRYAPIASRLVDAEIQLVAMNVGMGGSHSEVTLQVNRPGEKHEEGPESLVVEASVKPFIGVLWAGTVVMFLGFFIALFKRSKEV
jgi:cytochrome c-type biogenesis protein CcmF